MATAQILQALSNMQSNVQSSVPFTPNNGNPAGAYNMAQGQAVSQQPAAPVNRYAWLQPSPYMDYLQQTLQDRNARLKAEMEQMYSQPVLPTAAQPAAPTVAPAPVIPQARPTVQSTLQQLVTGMPATQATGAPVIPRPQPTVPVRGGTLGGTGVGNMPLVLPTMTGTDLLTRTR